MIVRLNLDLLHCPHHHAGDSNLSPLSQPIRSHQARFQMEWVLPRPSKGHNQRKQNSQRDRHDHQDPKPRPLQIARWLCLLIHGLSASILPRTCATNPSSFSDSRLISTLASAPSIAARASAAAVTRSDFILGLVIGPRASAIRRTSLARSATLSGTVVACFSAASTMPSADADCFAFLYAAITD